MVRNLFKSRRVFELRRVFGLRKIFESRRVTGTDFARCIFSPIPNILKFRFSISLLSYSVAYINLLYYSIALI